MKRRNVFGAFAAFMATAITSRVVAKDGVFDYAHYITINARPDLPQTIGVEFSGKDIVFTKEVKLNDKFVTIQWSRLKWACRNLTILPTALMQYGPNSGEMARDGFDDRSCDVNQEIIHFYKSNGDGSYERIDMIPIRYYRILKK